MKKFSKLYFIQFILSFLFMTQAIATPPLNIPGVGSKYVLEELIVKFKAKVTRQEVEIINLQNSTSILAVNPTAHFMRLKIHGNNHSVRQIVNKYRSNKKVEYAEPNYIVHISQMPNDSDFSLLWGLNNNGQTGGVPDADIDAPEAWGLLSSESAVVVAVIDSGVDYEHQDLAEPIWNNPGEIPGNGIDDDANGYIDDVYGWNFSDNNNMPLDDHGHGTHVTGVIAATGGNGVGVIGVSKTARIMALKFLDANGSGTTADAASAIQYATDMGAKITNNSWGGSAYSQAVNDAISAANAEGILFIAAAGNEGTNNDILPFYPADYDVANIITVAASDHNDQLAIFSNYGPSSVDLAAPGVDIFSTTPDNTYSDMSGTSMATPHVSGVIAMLMAEFPALTHIEIKQRLLNAVDAVASVKGRVATGGRLNAHSSMLGVVPAEQPEPVSVFDDNVESGLNGWTLAGDTSLWHQTNNRFISSYTAWYYGFESVFNYDAGTKNQGSIVTPAIDLTNITSSALTFWHFLDTEETSGFDKAVVRISNDGGSTFTDIFTKPTSNGGFVQESLNISAYDGEVIQVQFSFDTVDNLYNDSEGWYIDDIKVEGQVADPVANISPTADAGLNQILSDSNGDGGELVGLNASGSIDTDGTIISYEWSDGQNTLLGVAVEFSFPVGNHTVTLTVTDDKGAIAVDRVVVTINPNQLPIANAGVDQTLVDVDNNTFEFITLTSLGSSDPDGEIVAYEWKEGGNILGSNATITSAFDVGEHPVTLSIIDDGGAISTDTVLISVKGAPVSGPTFYVSSIDVLLLSRGSRYTVRGLVHVVDNKGSSVKGAVVTANWLNLNGNVIKTASSQTDKKGVAYLDYGKVSAKPGETFSIIVNDISKDGFSYDSSKNVETSDKEIIQ